jgi:hypothetical protein
VRGWLVEGEDRRLLREAQRDGRELSLTGAQGSYIAMLQMCCANPLNGGSSTLAIMGAWTSGAATVWDATECHELLNARGEWERDVGAHYGDRTRNRFAREVLDRLGTEDYFAGGCWYCATECTHERGFSGAVWTHDGDAFSWSNAE